MSNTANTFTSLKPELKETYSDKNKKFKKIKQKLSKKDCECKPEPKNQCGCKK